MTGVRVLPVRSARLDLGRLPGQSQPEPSPVATHRLLVDRPALAVEHDPDPPVAEPRVEAREGLDPPCQGRPLVADDRRVTEAGPGQVQRPRDATLRDAKAVA